MRRSTNYYIRKSHRYLGVFIGVQFLLWTIGGLYFSWMNIKTVRGEDLVNTAAEPILLTGAMLAPDVAVAAVARADRSANISQITMSNVLGKTFYEISADTAGGPRVFLIDAATGTPRENLSASEAIAVARARLAQTSNLVSTDYVTADAVGPHHEYRGRPLPAWAVSFDTPREFVVYVSAESGRIEAVRSRGWRVFDFLWMLHTMDYNGRDDINNYLLRGFAVLGLLTIASGFVLFAISSPPLRRRLRARQR